MNLETARERLLAEGIDASTTRGVLAEIGRAAFALDTAGADPEELWTRLRSSYDRTGLFPVILAAEALSMIEEGFEGDGGEPEKDLRKGRERDGAGWIARHRREIVDELGELPRAEWPEDADIEDIPLMVGYDDDGQPTPGTLIALIPCEHPWEAIGRLGFGDWNECPPPWVHIAVHRSWQERFGAEPIALSADTLQMRVARRPQTREEALALAEEQMVYCEDIVYQGAESLESLAASLLCSDYWYFWWD